MLQNSPAGKGCRVPSYMVRPIHRVPRYKLLLESEPMACIYLATITAQSWHGTRSNSYHDRIHQISPQGSSRFGECERYEDLLVIIIAIAKCSLYVACMYAAALVAISDALKYMNSRITEIVRLLLLFFLLLCHILCILISYCMPCRKVRQCC